MDQEIFQVRAASRRILILRVRGRNPVRRDYSVPSDWGRSGNLNRDGKLSRRTSTAMDHLTATHLVRRSVPVVFKTPGVGLRTIVCLAVGTRRSFHLREVCTRMIDLLPLSPMRQFTLATANTRAVFRRRGAVI